MESIPQKQKAKDKRTSKIVKVSIIGIAANVLLSGFKALVGFLSGSIAIVLDAANNLSDAASPIVTIVGAKLANRQPDHKHPFGHGRIEYLSAMGVGILVLYTGIALLVESIKKIITPNELDYTAATFIVVIVAIFVKLLLSIYVTARGKKLKSQSLTNSGKDARLDVLISAMTLLAAIVYVTTGLSLEAYLAVFISVAIIYSGFEMLREAVSLMLGERPSVKLIRDINRRISKFEGVHGSFDLVLNNYGPDSYIGSVNIEVDDTLSATQIDALSREISSEIYKKDNVILSSIGIYAKNTKDAHIISLYTELERMLKAHKNILQIHGFNIDEKNKTMRFDVVFSFEEKHPDELYAKVLHETTNIFPDYDITIIVDSDYALA